MLKGSGGRFRKQHVPACTSGGEKEKQRHASPIGVHRPKARQYPDLTGGLPECMPQNCIGKRSSVSFNLFYLVLKGGDA
jgi:hypothetical protein